MRCTDNQPGKRRRLTKRQRRKRILLRRMRRIFLLLCMILLAVVVSKVMGREKYLAAEYEADNYNHAYYKEELFAADLCVADPSIEISLSNVSELKAYGLFDIDQADAVYSYQVHTKVYPASTTKILTALVALENSSLSDTVTIGKNASASSFAWDEQTCGMEEGDTISMEDLLYGLLLYSGNDTAVAIAEHVGGSVEGFADMMNEKAVDLMATNSHFMNPSGLYDDEHYTTAYDLYLIFNECIKNEDFVNIISADSHTAKVISKDGNEREISWEPTNEYAQGNAESPEDIEVIGGKTGTLKAAGRCLILMSEDKNSDPYISVVMGAESKEFLYQDMTAILEQIPTHE